MKRIIPVIMLIILAGCGDRYDYTQVADEPAPLITGFQSYMRSKSVGVDVRSRYGWEIVLAEALPPGDERPPFSTTRVSLPRYTHLGYPGELQLSFFNDRLEGTWFYPKDPESYLLALAAQGVAMGIIDSVLAPEPATTRTIAVPPHGLIVIARDKRGKPFVAWVDRRIQQERTRWIEKHS